MSSNGQMHSPDLPDETENYLLWTCTDCDTSVNIFTRSEHLLSQSHRLRLAAQNPKNKVKWRCVICDVVVPEMKQEEHLMGWGHMLNIRPREGVEEKEGGGWNGMEYVGKGKKRKTFYCMTCRLEFPLDEQEEHVAGLACRTADDWIEGEGSEAEVGEEEEEEEDGEERDSSEAGIEEEKASYTGVGEEAEAENEIPKQEKDVNTPPLCIPTSHSNTPEAELIPDETFICPTCSDRSFPLSEKSNHGRRTWKCQTCNLTMHRSEKVTHRRLPSHSWHCNLCEKSVSLEGRESHEKSEKHQIRMGMKVPEVPKAATHVTMKAGVPEGKFLCCACNSYILLADKLQHASRAWRCDICGRFTHSDWKDAHMMQQHRSANAPSRGYASITVPDGSASMVTTFHCPPCNSTMPLVNKITHLASIAHCRNLPSPSFNVSKPQVPMQTTTLSVPPPLAAPTATTKSEPGHECPVCHITMSADNMASHLKGKKHQEALRLAGEGNKFYCEPCKKFKSEVGMADHLKSKKHKKKVVEWKRVKAQARQEAKALVGKGEEKSIPVPAPAHRPQAPESDKFYCEVCGVFKYVIGRADHVKSMKHKKKSAKSEREQVLKVQMNVQGGGNPKPTYYCDICNRNFFIAQRDLHMAGILHQEALQLAKKAADREAKRLLDKREEVTIPVPVTLKPPRTLDGDKFYCEACDKFKSVEGRAGHMKSKKHKRKVVDWEGRQVVRTQMEVQNEGEAAGKKLGESANRVRGH